VQKARRVRCSGETHPVLRRQAAALLSFGMQLAAGTLRTAACVEARRMNRITLGSRFNL
jgi:hypothetical protein